MQYKLMKDDIEVKKISEIKEGCTLNQHSHAPEVIGEYEDKDIALDELKKYKSSINQVGHVYNFIEYYIQEENDGGFDIWEFSKIIINDSLIRDFDYEQGKKILENLGYIQDCSAEDSQNECCDYVLDTYFNLYDEDGDVIHTVSFVEYYNKNDDVTNDDGSMDYLVKSYWTEI